MLAREATLTIIDFETTGVVEGYPDEPWQIGMVRFEQGRLVPGQQFIGFLRVGDRPFSPYATANSRQRRAEIAQSPTLQELWPNIRGWLLDLPLAAHNVGTEKKVLRAAAPLHAFGPWIDTLRLARRAYPRLAAYDLETLVQGLALGRRLAELCPDRAPHDALYDALACGLLLEHLLSLPGWEDIDLEVLASI